MRYIQDGMERIHLTFSQSQDAPGQFIYTLPEGFGSGGVRVDCFSSGLNLFYMDLSPARPVAIAGEQPAGYCGISFNLTGRSRIRSSKYWHSFMSNSGFSSHYINSDPFIVEEEVGGTRKVKVAVIFDIKTLLDLADEDEESFLPLLKGLGSQIFATAQEKINTEMRRTLNQMVACPYKGKIRRLFLEGKMMEVFALKLEQMRATGKSIPRQPCINKIDTERIYFAAQLLVRDPVNPPDLTALAGKIGMSRSKFYHNFKLVFGHSPMAHLRRHRLQTARQLLKQGRHNVAEAAFAVGYNNPSNFAKIFVARFGVFPHEVA